MINNDLAFFGSNKHFIYTPPPPPPPDVNECALHNGGCTFTCINLIDGYECHCPSGYVLTDNTNCTGDKPFSLIRLPLLTNLCISPPLSLCSLPLSLSVQTLMSACLVVTTVQSSVSIPMVVTTVPVETVVF